MSGDNEQYGMTTVANFKDVRDHWNAATQLWDDPRYVYIGRRNGRYNLPASKWANPHKLEADTPTHRNLVIQKYASATRFKISGGELDIDELRGKVLVCWCAPEACHGDWLAQMANAASGDSADEKGS